ncbi:hypothetical protein ACFL59_01690 [Planctomycetota bacterium]
MLPEPGLPESSVDFLYRVFCVKKDMPPLESLLERLITNNPRNPEDGFVFPPPNGLRRLQDALGASPDYFCMGYLREEAPQLWEEAEAALADQATLFDESDRLTVLKGSLCVVLRAQIKNPETNQFVETLVHLADAFQDLQHGVVWDVYMQKLWGRGEWPQVLEEIMSPLSHVRVIAEQDEEESWATLRTSGLVKFGSPDLELCRVPRRLVDETTFFLLDVTEHLMRGDILLSDDVVTYRDAKFRVMTTSPRGESEIFRIVDAPESEETPLEDTDGAEGAPQLLEAIRKARISLEGERARDGLPASQGQE